MTKYFLNIRQSGKTKKDNEQIYKFDLETPLLFPSALGVKKEFKYLEVKTSKNKNDFFHNTGGKGGMGEDFSPITTYWNLCVPDDNQGFSLLADNDKLTLGDEGGKIYLELFHFELSTLRIKPSEIIWKSKENFRVTLSENCFIRDETQGFSLDFNQIELEGEKYDKLRDIISNCIEKGQVLTLKFRSPNRTYFRKNYANNQATNTLVIPENSLKEDLTTQNQNSSSSSPDKSFYLLLGAIVIVSLCLIFFLTKLWKSRKK